MTRPVDDDSTAADSTDPHRATRDLLVAELDAKRFGHPGYLPWFYDDNPRGAAIQQHDDDPETGRRIAHYAVLPTTMRTPTSPQAFIFSSNVATDSSTRRSGLFRALAERMYADAAASGAPAMVGVGNDASTVVVVERFGWRRIGPMRAKVCVPSAPRGIVSHRVDEAFLGSPVFAEITQGLDDVPVRAWAQSWDSAFLRWRLSRPDGGYVVHVSANALAVSVRTQGPLGIPFAVLLKVWPRPGATLPTSGAPMAGAAMRSHSAPLCVYAGWNEHVHVRGVVVPHRFQPSPLNVVVKGLDPAFDADAFSLDTWELLDMDAY